MAFVIGIHIFGSRVILVERDSFELVAQLRAPQIPLNLVDGEFEGPNAVHFTHLTVSSRNHPKILR